MAARLMSTWLAACLLMAAGVSARAQSEPEANRARAVELERVIVTPAPNPLDDSRERLREMMEDAPCLGCGPMQDESRRDVYETAGRLVREFAAFTAYPIEVPNPSPDERRDARLANDWRVAEYGPEMQALR